MQLAPSKNPEIESKRFSTLGLAFGVVGLVLWFIGIAGFAFSMRGIILSKRTHNRKQLTMSAIGLVLSGFAIAYGLSR